VARVTVYRPTALSLPENSRRTRRFLDKRSQLSGRALLDEGDYAQYDQRSLFHDMFLDGDDLCAVGPPLLNLKREVMPFRLRTHLPNGSSSDVLRHRMRQGDRVVTHRFRLPAEVTHADEVRVSIDLATGQRAEVRAARAKLAPVFLQFATLQKNSPFAWIADWLGHAARLGVDRVILYDNGSDDVESLPERLRALPLALEIVLVHWPYAYGPLRNYRNRFSQPSQIVHSHSCFGASDWSGNFDIDEYLVVGPSAGPSANTGSSPTSYLPTGASLAGGLLTDRLRRCSPRTGLLRLDSYWVPRVGNEGQVGSGGPFRSGGQVRSDEQTGGEQPSSSEEQIGDGPHGAVPTARDFAYRERQLRGKSFKYLLRRKALRAPRIHNARLKLGWWRERPAPDDLVFLHYKALTTGWKQYHDRQSIEPVEASRHIEERRVQASLAALDADGPAAGKNGSSVPFDSRPQQVNS